MDNVFEDAIDVLRERGWHQGFYEDRDSRAVCILGACGVATSGSAYGWQPEILEPLAEALRVLGYPVGSSQIAEWNDQPERTVEDVLLVLKHAAADQ